MRFYTAVIAALVLATGLTVPAYSQVRTLVDQPDTISGIQIKPVYVLPADMADSQADTNGQISRLLTEGNDFLQKNLGLKFEIDTTASGEFDIAFFQTKRSARSFSGKKQLDLDSLLFESRLASNSIINRKIYVFFSPVQEGLGYCGHASMPGNSSLVLMGLPGVESSCSGPHLGFQDFASWTWVHEVFHSLGVNHVSDPCDMMYGGNESCTSGRVVIDPTNSQYVNNDRAGVDVLRLPVWSGSNTSSSRLMTCKFLQKSENAPISKALCPLGRARIGANEFCSGPGRAVLQQLNMGRWANRASGSFSRAPWGKPSIWECSRGDTAPTALIRENKLGVQTFRWVVNGYPERPFKVQWQR